MSSLGYNQHYGTFKEVCGTRLPKHLRTGSKTPCTLLLLILLLCTVTIHYCYLHHANDAIVTIAFEKGDQMFQKTVY